jgi:hypothetical protein
VSNTLNSLVFVVAGANQIVKCHHVRLPSYIQHRRLNVSFVLALIGNCITIMTNCFNSSSVSSSTHVVVNALAGC